MAEGCPLCGKMKPHCVNICDTHGGSVKCKCGKQGWSICAFCEGVTCEPHTLSTGNTPWDDTICPDCAKVEWEAESNAYLAEWGAESNKMKSAILRGLQAAIREEYATFVDKADIADTVNLILRELGQLVGDEKIEMIDVAAGPAIRIDPYDVVAAMAKAANQMDNLNEENMVCWDLPDTFLNNATKRLGWGLQSVFGIHALSAKVDGKPTWRVSGYPQAIETWFMLYNSLRINLEKEMKGIMKSKAEQFYQAFTMHIRENDNVAKMIEANADHKEKAKALSKDCFPVAEVTKFIHVDQKIDERAIQASQKLEPFGSEGTISKEDYMKYALNNPSMANRFDNDDLWVFVLGVAVGTVGTFIGNIWSHKYLKQLDSPIKKD